MATSPQSLYLARAFRSLGQFLEQKPSTAFALGNRVEIIGFAHSERHLNVIAKEHGLDVEELPGGDLCVTITHDTFSILVYLCSTGKDGK